MEKGTKKIGVRLILSYLLGILFIFVGAMNFSQSIFGAILLVFGGLIILPKFGDFLEERFKIKLSGWLKFILFLIFIGVGMSLTTSQTNNLTNNLEENQDNSEEGVVSGNSNQFRFGETFVVGDFEYTFNSFSSSNEIGSNVYGTFVGEKADGEFLIIEVTIENVGDSSKTLFSSNFKIIDEEGRTYNSDLGAGFYLEQDTLLFEQYQPGLPKTGTIVFDLPEDILTMIEVSSDNIWSNEKKYVIFEFSI